LYHQSINIESDYKLVLGFSYNFQTNKKQIKSPMVYETATENVLSFIESILQDVKRIQHARLS
jgi:hypothetical protein